MVKKYPLGKYGLSIILAILFVVCWGLQSYAGWKDFSAEAKSHNEVAQMLGDEGYVWHWASQTMENWQSEFLQLLTFVVLTAYFVHANSHESRDTDDQVDAQLKRIEAKLDRLSEQQPS